MDQRLPDNLPKQFTKEQAIALYDSEWWKGKDARAICDVQLFQRRLCMPFGEFHGAVETALGRPVWTHEFVAWDSIIKEYLGEKNAPTMEQILELIPPEKLVVVVAGTPH
jgi:hypothetical protein